MSKKISAVILTYNSEKTIERCLTDLVDTFKSLGIAWEAYVVDNGSKDQSRDVSREFATRLPQSVFTIEFDENLGTTRSRNAALERVSGDYILILDSDAYINPEAMKALIGVLEAEKDIGIAVPRLFYGSGRFQLSCDTFPTASHKLRRYLFLRRMEERESPIRRAQKPLDVDYAISACWLIRRSAFNATGMLDERIFYSPEDVDYCLRVWQSGYRVTYVPAAEVIHDAQELSRGLRLSKFHFSHLAGLVYLFRKHGYFWDLGKVYRRISRARNAA